MSEQSNIDNAKRWAEAIMTGHLDTFDDLVTPGVIDHDAAPEQSAGGAAGFKAFFTMLRGAFPDIEISVAHMLAHGDEVAIAYTIEGTHRGTFAGIAPTGKRVTARGMQIGRYVDGKMVERWGSSDELGIVQTLRG